MARAFVAQLYILMIFLPVIAFLISIDYVSHYTEPIISTAVWQAEDINNDFAQFLNMRNVSIDRASDNSQLNLTIDTATPEDSVDLSQYKERLNLWLAYNGYNISYDTSNIEGNQDLPLLTSNGFEQITSKHNFTVTFYGNSNVTSLEGIQVNHTITSFFTRPRVRKHSRNGNLSVDVYFDDGSDLWHIYGNVDPTYTNYIYIDYGSSWWGPPWGGGPPWWGSNDRVYFYFGRVDGHDYSFKVYSTDSNDEGWVHLNVQVNPDNYLLTYYQAQLTVHQGNIYKEAPGIVIGEG